MAKISTLRDDENAPASGEVVLYKSPGGDVRVECMLRDETLWLTQKAIAELFAVNVPAISKHLKNIFESGELRQEAVISILETTAADSLAFPLKNVAGLLYSV